MTATRRSVLTAGAASFGAMLLDPRLAQAAGRTLTIALPNNPSTMDPIQTSNHDGMAISNLVFENLLEVDLDGNAVPCLARAMPNVSQDAFLADASTRGTPRRSIKAFHAEVHERLPKVERELMQAQVEIASAPSTDFAEARAALAGLRERLARIGRGHGILVLAAGTHPVARWTRQRHTKKDRYEALVQEMQMLGRRNIVCGMHVPVEVPRPEDRVDLMNRLLPYMPLLLALSASSPFWQGYDTGLAAYRLSVWGEMPRTGLPDLFRDAADYEQYVATMVRSGAITDASFLWWTLRPSIHFPTLELRVADSCTRLEDTLAIAALYRCLVRAMVRRPELNREQTGAVRAITAENLWRAQRDGIQASFLDAGGGEIVPFAAQLAAVIALVAEDADALGCAPTVEWAREIAAIGTSADRQRSILADARANGGESADGMRDVVDWIAATTG